MVRTWPRLKFHLQVLFYTTLGVAAVVIPTYQMCTSVHPLRWGAALAGVLATTAYLIWVYRSWADLPWLGGSIHQGVKGHNRIAFTFDDGPNHEHTAAVLDVLKRHGARGTFFCVGRLAAEQPELIQRMAAEGHDIGNHTHQHRKLSWESPRGIDFQIDSAQAAIAQAGVPTPTLFRAPHGFKSPFLPAALRCRGMRLCAWSVDVQDFQSPGTDVLVRRGWNGLRDGEIVLMHDGGGERSQTAEALDRFLVECRRRGLQAVTLSELLSAPAASTAAR